VILASLILSIGNNIKIYDWREISVDVHHLKIFFEACKEKSFTKAAKNLFISQSAVSKQNWESSLLKEILKILG